MYNFFKKRKVLFVWLSGAFLNILTFFYVLFKLRSGDFVLPLKYNVVYGAELSGSANNLYYLPVSAVVLYALNLAFYSRLKNSSYFYAPLFAVSSLAVAAVFFFAVLFIISYK